MLRSKVLVLIVCFVVVFSAEYHVRNTKYGQVRGLLKTNYLDGSEYYAYLGIPYAKVVTEKEKFKDSQPVEPWSGVLDATQYSNSCISYDMIFGSIEGSLDCLYINVYVPKNANTNLASMVWIHGGGFLSGSGESLLYGPDFLLTGGVIVVTLNYRLGPFGFLNAGICLSPGNMGLKDQIRAIRFFREIVVYFGGDPDRITIFGESAGAASVHFHLLSPMSQDYFHSAIIESGSALDFWAYTKHPSMGIQAIKKALNLKSTTPAEIAEELTNDFTASEIAETFYKPLIDGEMSSFSCMVFFPSKEEKLDGCEQFLPDDPINLMIEGKMKKAPIIIGVNRDEGAMFFAEIFDYFESFEDKDPKHFNNLLSPDIKDVSNDPETIGTNILEYYTHEKAIGGSEEQMIMYLSDILFFYNWFLILNYYKQHNIPLYAYFYQERTEPGVFKESLGITLPTCMHGEELLNLFHMDIAMNKPEENSTEEFLCNLFISLWTNFVKTDNPTPEGNEWPNWETYTDTMKVMKLDTNPRMIDIQEIPDNFTERMCFLKSLRNEEHQKIADVFPNC